VVVLTTKYSSLGALISFGLLPLNIILFDSQGKDKLPVALLATLFILIRHTDNIRRLIKGTERKIGERS
jgi:glycerol-3-phosphate acyltransferase PlsY